MRDEALTGGLAPEADLASAPLSADRGSAAPSELVPGGGADPWEAGPGSGAGPESDRPGGTSGIESVPSHDARSKACGACVAPGGSGSHRAPSRSIHW